MNQCYRYAVVYFVIFGVLLLTSALWLHALKIGFTPGSLSTYYLGAPDGSSTPRSVQGLLETARPHFGAVGLFIMVSGHFLLFASRRSRRFGVMLSVTAFAAALLNIALPFVSVAGFPQVLLLKSAAFALFCSTAAALLLLVFRSALGGIRRCRRTGTGC